MRFHSLQTVPKPINFCAKDTIPLAKTMIKLSLLFNLIGKYLHFKVPALPEPIVVLEG